MCRLIYLFLAFLCAVSLPVSAEENKKASYIQWHLRDLYYQDANDTMVQLELAPKLSTRFLREMTSEEKTALVAEFSPTGESEQPGDSTRTLIAFNESITPAELLQAANKIASSGNAEVRPVFYVDNMEAVLDGLVVEPKIVLTPERLLERMQKFGGFKARQTLSEENTWVFLAEEIKPPLNLLVFTNLVSRDTWVKRAYPRFKFLHDPIVASIIVEPVSGTVGEMRRATFTIRIFDSAISLAQELIPEFGKGLFAPIQGLPSSPSSIKHVPGYLWELVGDPVRNPVIKDKRSRIYRTSWQFKNYAIGEWTIHPQTVPYKKNGIDQEIKSSGFTHVVNSQIGKLDITDMPRPYSLVHLSEKTPVVSDVKLPPVPSYWFDAWISRPELVAKYARIAGIFLGLLPFLGIIAVSGRAIKGRVKKERTRRGNQGKIESLLREAQAEHSYAKYYEALSLMLRSAVPGLSAHPTWEEIKDAPHLSEVLGPEITAWLEGIFGELNRRYTGDFTSTDEDIETLHRDLGYLFNVVRQLGRQREEA